MSSTPSPAQNTGKGLLPSNRTAALAAFIVGLAGCATSLAGVYPNPATNEVALILGGTASIAGPISHVIGSWLWDKRTTDVQIAILQLEQQRIHAESLNSFSNSNGSVEDFKADFTEERGEPGPPRVPAMTPWPVQETPSDFPTSTSGDESGSDFTDLSGSSSEMDYGIDLGPLDESHNPEHSLAPESENTTSETTESAVPETGPEIQKTNGGEA